MNGEEMFYERPSLGQITTTTTYQIEKFVFDKTQLTIQSIQQICHTLDPTDKVHNMWRRHRFVMWESIKSIYRYIIDRYIIGIAIAQTQIQPRHRAYASINALILASSSFFSCSSICFFNSYTFQLASSFCFFNCNGELHMNPKACLPSLHRQMQVIGHNRSNAKD